MKTLFSIHTKCVNWPEDVERLKELVEKNHGIWEGAFLISRLNIWNKPIAFNKQYLCVYHLDKEIEMEVFT